MTDEDAEQQSLQEHSREEDRVQRNISESADKLRLEAQVKRGDGTRDEDRIKVKVKGDDPETVVRKLNETIMQLHTTADGLRGIQPGEDADDD